MRDFLLESPVLLGVSGMLVSGTILFFWTQTGHKAALYSGGIVAAVTAVLMTISVQIETDRERIEKILNQVADALERGDYEKVYGYIHPNAAQASRRARSELPNYRFTDARVTRIKSITVNRSSTPPTALAEFHVMVAGDMNGHPFKLPRFIKVYFMDRNGTWLVRDYEHFDAATGFRNTPLGR